MANNNTPFDLEKYYYCQNCFECGHFTNKCTGTRKSPGPDDIVYATPDQSKSDELLREMRELNSKRIAAARSKRIAAARSKRIAAARSKRIAAARSKRIASARSKRIAAARSKQTAAARSASIATAYSDQPSSSKTKNQPQKAINQKSSLGSAKSTGQVESNTRNKMDDQAANYTRENCSSYSSSGRLKEHSAKAKDQAHNAVSADSVHFAKFILAKCNDDSSFDGDTWYVKSET
ncbi:hypothetical protein TNCT_484401 [Trichonephila clavata]|uniref:Uncharacterized protein n=1 Tax=Trichonephila clavata TaxID=2740835 RepID=A0A8X6JKD3_TRICU|nr:hypothetical protein TNCT_484401 [Trichonephila clavata]